MQYSLGSCIKNSLKHSLAVRLLTTSQFWPIEGMTWWPKRVWPCLLDVANHNNDRMLIAAILDNSVEAYLEGLLESFPTKIATQSQWDQVKSLVPPLSDPQNVPLRNEWARGLLNSNGTAKFNSDEQRLIISSCKAQITKTDTFSTRLRDKLLYKENPAPTSIPSYMDKYTKG